MTEVTRAWELVRGSQNALARLTVAIALARFRGLAQPASAASALAALQDAEAQARRLGLVHLGFEAALFQAEIARGQHRADADARLATLIKDAKARGFGSIAARASALRTTPKT